MGEELYYACLYRLLSLLVIKFSLITIIFFF